MGEALFDWACGGSGSVRLGDWMEGIESVEDGIKVMWASVMVIAVMDAVGAGTAGLYKSSARYWQRSAWEYLRGPRFVEDLDRLGLDVDVPRFLRMVESVTRWK
jgi:hypothetical protein